MKAWRHFKTITYHKLLVMQGCFKVGLYRQGLLHDLSKYSPAEFLVGAKYYQGTRSPNNAEREAKGYSASWLHHKGRNKHHYEYWVDYSIADPDQVMSPVRMPEKYLIEMFMDRIAASKVYNKGHYTDEAPLAYYRGSLEKAPDLLHPHTRAELEKLLLMLAGKGEAETFAYIRRLRKERRRKGRRGRKKAAGKK